MHCSEARLQTQSTGIFPPQYQIHGQDASLLNPEIRLKIKLERRQDEEPTSTEPRLSAKREPCIQPSVQKAEATPVPQPAPALPEPLAAHPNPIPNVSFPHRRWTKCSAGKMTSQIQGPRWHSATPPHVASTFRTVCWWMPSSASVCTHRRAAQPSVRRRAEGRVPSHARTHRYNMGCVGAPSRTDPRARARAPLREPAPRQSVGWAQAIRSRSGLDRVRKSAETATAGPGRVDRQMGGRTRATWLGSSRTRRG